MPEGQRRHLHPNNREEMMLPQSNETLQVVAGIRLLAWSHLVRWDDGARQFYARSFDDFSAWWKHIEPTFGRLICWIQFAAGAEHLAKGVCLLCGQVNRLIDDRGYPLTIGGLTYENPKKKKLSVFRYIGTKGLDSEKIIEGYRYLASKHRNRDINYYVKNIRDDHFHEVREIFVPCFNILIGVVPDQASIASALLA